MYFRSPDGVLYDNVPVSWTNLSGKVVHLGTFNTAKRYGWVVEESPLPEEVLALHRKKFFPQAERLMEDPYARDAINVVISRIEKILALGIPIENWTIKDLVDALEVKAASTSNFEEKILILQNGSALMPEWIRVVYHCKDSFSLADELWPYLYEIAKSEL